MKHNKVAEFIKSTHWKDKIEGSLQSVEFAALIKNMTAIELKKRFDTVVDIPIKSSLKRSKAILYLYYLSTWVAIFEMLDGQEDMHIFEVASGGSVSIPCALDIYSDGHATYVTANMNKDLTTGFYNKTAHVSINCQVITDDAAHIGDYYLSEEFHMILFQHAINDIFQTIAAEINGIDTVQRKWRNVGPETVKVVTGYYLEGTLKEKMYPQFIHLIKSCDHVLKQGGYMIFNNCIFQHELDWGYPAELYGAFIEYAREWIQESNIGLEVVTFDSFDSKWWLFLRKEVEK